MAFIEEQRDNILTNLIVRDQPAQADVSIGNTYNTAQNVLALANQLVSEGVAQQQLAAMVARAGRGYAQAVMNKVTLYIQKIIDMSNQGIFDQAYHYSQEATVMLSGAVPQALHDAINVYGWQFPATAQQDLQNLQAGLTTANAHAANASQQAARAAVAALPVLPPGVDPYQRAADLRREQARRPRDPDRPFHAMEQRARRAGRPARPRQRPNISLI